MFDCCGVALSEDELSLPAPSATCDINLGYIIAQVMQRFSKVACGLEYAATLVFLCVVLHSTVLASSSEKQPERPRILGIDHVTVYVSDVEKSRQFYSEFLGLTTNCPQHAGPEPCYLVAPSDQRVLLKRAPAQQKIRLSKIGSRKLPSPPTISWECAVTCWRMACSPASFEEIPTVHDPSESATRRAIPLPSCIGVAGQTRTRACVEADQ